MTLRFAGPLVLGFLVGCSSSSATPSDAGTRADAAAATTPDAAVAPPPGHVVVTPGALLLTASGQQATLAAEAFDGQDAPLAGPVTWTSSKPDVVSVDDAGRVTALAAVGSAQITASVGDAVSPPVLVVVAEPVPGAVLVTDAQVLAGPDAVDVNAPVDLGFLMRLTLAPEVQVANGAILLALEDKPVAGRVVATQPGVSGTEVTLELVALPDLFRNLELDDTYHVDEVAETPAVTAQRAAAKLPATMFNIGPLECEADTSLSTPVTGTASLRVAPRLDVHRQQILRDGEVERMHVDLTGTLTVTGTITVKLVAGFEGSVTCKLALKRVPLPIGGAISLIGGFEVPLGIKGQIKGAVTFAQIEAGLEVQGTSTVSMGFDYTSENGVVPFGDFDQTLTVKPKLTLPDYPIDAVIGVSVAVGPTAGLDVGIHLPFLGNASLGLLDAWASVKLEATLFHYLADLAETTLASKYEAKAGVSVGPGKDVKKALSFLGGRAQIGASVSVEEKLASSPTGTMQVDRPEVQPGDEVHFAVDLVNTSFLFFDNVSETRIYHGMTGGEGVEVVATLPAGAHGSWTWTPRPIDVGVHTYWAVVVTVLAPGLQFEIKEDSSLTVHVEPSAPKAWQGTVAFDASGSDFDTGENYRFDYSLSGSGSVTVKEALATPGLLYETAASATATYTVVTTFTPSEVPPDVCSYSTVTTDTNSGSMLALDRETVEVQLLVDEFHGMYTLFLQPPKLSTIDTRVTVSSKVSGPATCDPGGTTENGGPADFIWEDVIANGTFTPDSNVISGNASMMRGANPVATYNFSWNLEKR